MISAFNMEMIQLIIYQYKLPQLQQKSPFNILMISTEQKIDTRTHKGTGYQVATMVLYEMYSGPGVGTDELSFSRTILC